MELLREKNYIAPERQPRMFVEQNYVEKANIYDRDCRHFIVDGLSGFCELGFKMCKCNKDCHMTTSGHVLEYPRCRLRETR